ncbi:uncharacterized protein LOC123552222 [Mercenaria mercenaria]|uniref:uncharacterized protein LOC123552222 n=1 Tax=Mercenaria mercenaria TaxID=6596 RepID=UPI00234FA167|nr:uncharacterized protein LOC123552222 [Mercenaria mercenaria]
MAEIGMMGIWFLAVLSVTTAEQAEEDGVTNVALHKNVLASVSEFDSSLAVDGKMTRRSCIEMETEGDIWWQVDLADIYTIFSIRVITSVDFYDTKVEEEESCYYALRAYKGKVNSTRSGRKCQRWDSQTPHKHSFTQEKYWYRGEDFLSDNYCRLPNYNLMPWCYTTDPKMRWEPCDIRVEECEYVLNSYTSLKIGTVENNLVDTDYTEVDDEFHHSWEFVLSNQTLARFVKLHQIGTNGRFHLCEVEIYGTKGEVTNVALHKSTEMSKEVVLKHKVLGSNLAVDGIKDQTLSGGSCFFTADGNNPWWRVDLGDFFLIFIMRIYNRIDCCSEKAHDLKLWFWNTPDDVHRLILEGQISDIHNMYTDIAARFLQLSLPESGDFHLCEVEVYGKIAECKSNQCKNGGSCSPKYCGDDSDTCRDYTCTCPTGFGGVICEYCAENIAFGKDIIASSISHPSWLPSYAIDGDTNQFVTNGATCVSTQKEIKPYLIIDLGSEYTLTSVKVYKRLDSDGISAVQLFLMLEAWTSYKKTYDPSDKISTFDLVPLVSTRLVRLQAEEAQPTSLQLCEIEVFAVCQEELASNTHSIKDESKPLMQMRFSLSEKYSDVVRSEDLFKSSIRKALSVYTGYSVESFQNVQLEKDPFRVSFELHAINGNLVTLSAMLEKIDKLLKQGVSDMKTEDEQTFTITAGSLQYYLVYVENTGTMLTGPLLTAVSMFFIVAALHICERR